MNVFRFKHFSVTQSKGVHKIGTDSMLLGALVSHHLPRHILDIGTGTGVLALMLAQKFSDASIHAIEIQPHAFELAKENFLVSPFTARLTIECSDIRNCSDSQYDLIISNPPYYTEDTKSQENFRDIARHEDSLPLNVLLKIVTKLLNPSGKFWIIIPYRRLSEITDLCKNEHLYIHQVISVHGKNNLFVRAIVTIGKENIPVEKKTFQVRTDDGTYSEEYIELTKEFHAFRPIR